jgi:hypothetical protein
MRKKGAKARRGKLQRRSEKPPPMANQQLGRQTRKILGKLTATNIACVSRDRLSGDGAR